MLINPEKLKKIVKEEISKTINEAIEEQSATDNIIFALQDMIGAVKDKGMAGLDMLLDPSLDPETKEEIIVALKAIGRGMKSQLSYPDLPRDELERPREELEEGWFDRMRARGAGRIAQVKQGAKNIGQAAGGMFGDPSKSGEPEFSSPGEANFQARQAAILEDYMKKIKKISAAFQKDVKNLEIADRDKVGKIQTALQYAAAEMKSIINFDWRKHPAEYEPINPGGDSKSKVTADTAGRTSLKDLPSGMRGRPLSRTRPSE